MTTSWTLTAPSFDRLLATLDDDRDRAADAYRSAHARVVGLFRWWGAAHPDALADVTLDRVGRALEQGRQIPRDSLGAYIRGVARMVFYEASRAERRRRTAETLAGTRAVDRSFELLDRLDQALLRLSMEERRLVLSYYGDGRSGAVRATLARELGVSPLALRVRAHRIRQRLHDMCEAMAA